MAKGYRYKCDDLRDRKYAAQKRAFAAGDALERAQARGAGSKQINRLVTNLRKHWDSHTKLTMREYECGGITTAKRVRRKKTRQQKKAAKKLRRTYEYLD